jgi:hypothetical protein
MTTTTTLAKVNTSEELSVNEILETYQVNPADWNESTASATHYWPAEKGSSIHGILVKSFVIEGKYTALYYIMTLKSPTMAIESATQEAVNLEAGDNIMILARDVLKRELEDKLDKEVIIVCTGQKQTRNGNDMWDYKVFCKKPQLSK